MSHGQEAPGGLNDDADHLIQPEESGPVAAVARRPPQDTRWKPASRTVEENLAQGLSNEDLWMLIRRFNKVRFSPLPPPLDRGIRIHVCSKYTM